MLTAQWQPRVFAHSTASATRIARFPINIVLGDLCDKASVNRAIEGCDAVVHLARGDSRVMTTGLENVLRAAVTHRCMRFVHLSSVAVYGNHPPPESVSEEPPPKPGDMAYGVEKLQQERRVLRYGRIHGLPVVILRPPNVYGPFSQFTVNVIEKIRTGKMPIVDGGQNPCNLVYVDNLVQAILLSLWKPGGVGETFFVTDSQSLSWERCLNDHALFLHATLPHVSRDHLVSKPKERLIWDSLRLLPGLLFSEEVRAQGRNLPLIKFVERALYKKFQGLSLETQQRLRVALTGPLRFPKERIGPEKIFLTEDPLIAAQDRTVAHSSDKAKRLLGYSAPVSYHDGMELTEKWLRYARMI